MSAPFASPPTYNEAVNSPRYDYDNPAFTTTTGPMSPAMIATVGRPSAMMSGDIYTESNSQDESPAPGEESSAFSNSFSDKAIRRAFIKKVYSILMVQMCVTLLFIVCFITIPAIGEWISQHSWFYYVSYGVFVVTYFVLVCIQSVRRKYPGNFVCLSVFTIAAAYMLASISTMYSTNIVLIAIGVTAIVCLSISLFAMQTRIDFTLTAGLLFTFVIIVMLFGFCTIITQFALERPLPIMNNVYGALLALLFAWFLVFDTQVIMGGKKIELSPEEYIFGALQLYMDIINLFLIILSFLGRSE